MLTLSTSDSVSANYDEWKCLWHAEQADPFLHPAWHAAFVEASGNKLAPILVCARRAGRLVGLMPLRQDAGGVMRFLTAPRSDYEDALVSLEGREEVLGAFADFLLGHCFEFGEMPQHSLLADVLKERGLSPRPASPCPGIQLTRESYQDVTGRKSLKRHEKKLSRRGEVSLELVAAKDLDVALGKFMDQHVARRTVLGDDSLFLDPLNRAFYRNLVSHPDFHECGAFHVLKAGSVEAAFHLGLANAGKFIWYKPTFDLNLESEGPGEVLLKTLIEYVYANDMAFFDFSRGNERFKLRFANEQRNNQRFTHSLPLSYVALRGIRGKWRGLRRRARLLASKFAHRAYARQVRWVEIPSPQEAPEAREGYSAEFAEADLTSFGGLRMRCPEYVTPERMRSAVERRKRGDRLVTVRRVSDGLPVHFSWFRMGPQPQSAGENEAGDSGEPIGAIFDAWTVRGESEELRSWATLFAAWHAGKLNLPVYVKSGPEDHIGALNCY